MSDNSLRDLERPARPVASIDSTTTPIGVDLGEYNLYVASPGQVSDRRGIHTCCGESLCARLDEFREQIVALLASEYDREPIAAYVQQRRDTLVAAIDDAAAELCAYASGYDRPVLVTEHSHFEPDLWAWLTDPSAHRGTAWLLPMAHRRLWAVAAEYPIAVETVPAAYSSQECYACGVLGERETTETFRCLNPACHVDTVSADANAARVLARRYYPGRCCARHSRKRADTDRPTLVSDGGHTD